MKRDVFSYEYGGKAYEEGTSALLMKQQLDTEIATELAEYTPSSVIDVGGGNGNLSRYITRAFQHMNIPKPSYVVMDSSASQLAVAESSEVPTIQMSMIAPQQVFQAPFARKEQFDAAVMENSLYAVTQNLPPEEVDKARILALTNVAGIVKPGGILVISDPLVKDKATFLKKLGKYVQREKKLKMQQGATNAEANWYVFRMLTSKPVLNSLMHTVKLAKSTTRFGGLEELVTFVEGTGYFQAVPGTGRDDAYLGDNALVTFMRTNKKVKVLSKAEQNLGVSDRIERVSVSGEPKTWRTELMLQFYDLEERAYSVYGDESEDRKESLAFVDDYFLKNKGENLFADPRKISIRNIKSTFYYAEGEKPIAFASVIEAEIHEPILWHGIVLSPGRILIPRKLMKDKDFQAASPPYWDDIYDTVASAVKKHGKVSVAAHFQPLSLKEMVKAGIVDPKFHANLQNHFIQSPVQKQKIQYAQRIMKLPQGIRAKVLSLFVKNEEKVQKVITGLRKIEKIIPILHTVKTAFTPDPGAESGFVVVQLQQNESKR